MKKLTIIEAPLVSEEFDSGVRFMPEALIKGGLLERLNPETMTKLPMPNWEPKRDPETQILNPEEVRMYSTGIATVVENNLKAGYFPLVVGGDCTILLGCLLALKRQSANHGLLFLDGHADFYEPGISPSGETADMELGFAIGRGPEILTNIEGQKPLVNEKNTVLFGFRDEALIAEAGGQDPRGSGMTCVSLSDIRLMGFANAIEKSLRSLTVSVDTFWIHVDVDVLDDREMPAVDYRMPDGLTIGELVSSLQRAIGTGKAAGMSISIFNPTLDWDGSLSKKLVELLGVALQEKKK